MLKVNISQIEQQKQNVELIRKVALQVQKDFQLFDVELHFSGNATTVFQELFDQMKPVLFRMLELDSSRFFALLYAIDVDETKVKQLLFEKHDKDVATELTSLILHRELVKVVSRQIFSQQSNF